jgi:thioesterase domain-containing protein
VAVAEWGAYPVESRNVDGSMNGAVDLALQRLQQKLSSMPPVRALELRAESWADGRLTLFAPLAPNVNDKGCAFGGSLASLMTLSAWGLSTLELSAAGFDDAEVYVQDSRLQYLAPLYDDLRAEASLALGAGWGSFVNTYRERGKARANLLAEVRRADGEVATRFVGRFVALRPR